jgi:hypothetical protein
VASSAAGSEAAGEIVVFWEIEFLLKYYSIGKLKVEKRHYFVHKSCKYLYIGA